MAEEIKAGCARPTGGPVGGKQSLQAIHLNKHRQRRQKVWLP